MPKPKRRQGKNDRRSNNNKGINREDILEKSDMHNDRFSIYYKAQQILPEDEWDDWMRSFKEPLPTTFRVAGSRHVARELNSIIHDVYVPSIGETVFEGEKVSAPTPIPWYPDGLAWQFNVSKKVLRKSPEFKKFHSFLVYETDVGNISRQEAVSMIPPLLLDVEPHHYALDMCAAPGSKTAQLLEAIHVNDTSTTTSVPTGLLIANDSDQKRAHMLIHQTSRLPSSTFMVTNLDASIYPVMKLKSPGHNGQLRFDRILCDVPCSGDGTLRKNIDIWKRWSPRDGNGLHGLQLRILLRAMKLIKEDGRIVYSTCSMNPVENEAVIADALQSYPDFEIVDVSDRLPGLIRRPGLTKWSATHDKSASVMYETYEDFLKAEKDPQKMMPGHWPPQNSKELGLEKCLRLYPHLQDTGGFFVAVLRKKSRNTAPTKKREADALANEPEPKKPRTEQEAGGTTPVLNEVKLEPETSDISTAAIITTPGVDTDAKEEADDTSTVQATPFKENPYTFLPPDDPNLLACIQQLHLTNNFPSSNVLVRNPNGEGARALYLANDIVKAIIMSNDYGRIRLTSAGTKVFVKQDAGKGAEAQFRILGESVSIAMPYMDPSMVMDTNMDNLKRMVEAYYPLCSTFDEPFKSAIEARPSGCHIVRFSLAKEDVTLRHSTLILPVWKSNVSITLMIDKKAKSALSLRMFGQDVTVAGREAQEQQRAKTERSSAAAIEADDPEDL